MTKILATILLLGIIFIAIVYFIYSIIKMTKEERVEMIINCLISFVAAAEKEFGSGTGELKLMEVYSGFTATYPWLAKTLSFEQFKTLVNRALIRFEKMLNNEAIKDIILNKDKEEKNE